jgi:uncharacterized protein
VSEVRFETEDGLRLEGELRRPDGEPVGSAVVCHPDPKLGGSKDHPLLWAIRNDLASRRGFVTLTFNFRGVMASEGTHTHGRDELKDLAAAITRVREEAPGPTVVAGWSFGANVALRHALTDDRVAALGLVGIPLGDPGGTVPPLPESFEGFETPVILLAGDDDLVCPEAEALRLAGRIPGADIRIVPGAGHHFPGLEREAAEAIGEFLLARTAH